MSYGALFCGCCCKDSGSFERNQRHLEETVPRPLLLFAWSSSGRGIKYYCSARRAVVVGAQTSSGRLRLLEGSLLAEGLVAEDN